MDEDRFHLMQGFTLDIVTFTFSGSHLSFIFAFVPFLHGLSLIFTFTYFPEQIAPQILLSEINSAPHLSTPVLISSALGQSLQRNRKLIF